MVIDGINMRYKIAILLAAIGCLVGFVPNQAEAAAISISIGDRPYYYGNPIYLRNRRRYVWIPGHWSVRNHHRFWRHGHWRARW